jgi:hypothetical protein
VTWRSTDRAGIARTNRHPALRPAGQRQDHHRRQAGRHAAPAWPQDAAAAGGDDWRGAAAAFAPTARFHHQAMFIEPMYVIVFFFACYIAAIVSARLDLNLDDGKKKSN